MTPLENESTDQTDLESHQQLINRIVDLLPHVVKSVKEEIGLLYRLSNTIRRASRDSQNIKATQNFKILDHDGQDLEHVLCQRFASNIRDLFPGISEHLQARISRTMIIRRKRVLYKRHRQEKRNAPMPDPVNKPEIQAPKPKSTSSKTAILEGNHKEQDKIVKEPVEAGNTALSVMESQARSATTLVADKFKQSSPSVVSATDTIAIGDHNDMKFPPPPLGYMKRRFKELKAQHRLRHPTQSQSGTMSPTCHPFVPKVHDLAFSMGRWGYDFVIYDLGHRPHYARIQFYCVARVFSIVYGKICSANSLRSIVQTKAS